ncbi:hypothetical protein AAF712_008737 [Marasmius tenuissimus]|uniref:Uncharacterized protein n=1 Tax=Marasmius tenuissimus TaxID=585030 RepID=A0ABR2ZU45_9AGAR
MFGALRLPALRNLQIDSDFQDPSALFAFLDRSQCQLEEFGFIDGCMSPVALSVLLHDERLQSVRTLMFLGIVDTISSGLTTGATVTRALLYPSPAEKMMNKVVLPNLASLTLSTVQFDDGDAVTALMDMLSSRRNIDHLPSTISRLQLFVVRGQKHFSFKDKVMQARFRKFCNDGLAFADVRND